MRKRKFWKMHGAGNDYIYFDCTREQLQDPAALAERLSDRHFSVGGDGIVLILPSAVADARMRMFNADGSEGKMCGNAIRCVAKFLRDEKKIAKDILKIETAAGIRTVEALSEDLFRVDMGKPEFSPDRIPARFGGRGQLTVGQEVCSVTCLSMGNPHCVVFTEDTDGLDLAKLGPQFETHPAFPERTNTEFTEVMSPKEIKVRVWERGSGETLACGTGACAAAVAAICNGYCAQGEIAVNLRGGRLFVCGTGENVFLTGPAAFAFEGAVEL